MADSSPGQGDDQMVDVQIRHIINAGANHDIKALTHFIDTYAFTECKAVDVQDSATGNTPLHASIASCGRVANGTTAPSTHAEVEGAEDTVRFLLENGAIWNQLNYNDMTPGCIAFEIGLMSLYQLMVDAGVRAELLLNRLDEYDQLDEDEDENNDALDLKDSDPQVEGPDIVVSEATANEDDQVHTANGVLESNSNGEPSTSSLGVSSTAYLSSALSMSDSKLLDAQQNGVMMAWEKGIMSKSADAILESPGLRVLNIGFGMGIIDSLIQSHPNQPAEHHIIEAHPDVLKEIENKGWPAKPNVFIHAGRWQDLLPTMANDGLVFDAIYYDTFAESYKDFKDFFSEHLLGILNSGGKWSFFNGMGADRQISYDVYQKVVEMDLFEAGYDVDWEEVDLPDLCKAWEGVRRKYWNVEKYRLPVCRFLD